MRGLLAVAIGTCTVEVEAVSALAAVVAIGTCTVKAVAALAGVVAICTMVTSRTVYSRRI